MNTLAPLAYLVLHPVGLPIALVWIINAILVLLFALLVWLVFQWVAAQFGVPAQIVKVVGIIIFIMALLSLFVG